MLPAHQRGLLGTGSRSQSVVDRETASTRFLRQSCRCRAMRTWGPSNCAYALAVKFNLPMINYNQNRKSCVLVCAAMQIKNRNILLNFRHHRFKLLFGHIWLRRLGIHSAPVPCPFRLDIGQQGYIIRFMALLTMSNSLDQRLLKDCRTEGSAGLGILIFDTHIGPLMPGSFKVLRYVLPNGYSKEINDRTKLTVNSTCRSCLPAAGERLKTCKEDILSKRGTRAASVLRVLKLSFASMIPGERPGVFTKNAKCTYIHPTYPCNSWKMSIFLLWVRLGVLVVSRHSKAALLIRSTRSPLVGLWRL